MDRITVIGLSWRQGGPEALARFSLCEEDRAAGVRRLAQQLGVCELVYLATCNRVEVALVGAEGASPARWRPLVFEALVGRPPAPGEAERSLRAWAGEGALEHLMLVAAGLDSARAGETDVSAQVRRAVEQSRSLGLIGLRLGIVFEEALRVARRVHAQTGLDAGRESLAEIGLDRLRARLSETPGRVALVGVSAMTERCARSLAHEDVPFLWVNRSLERVREQANQLGAEACGLAEFKQDPEALEALVLATGAPTAVLVRADLERVAARAPSGRPPLLIDFSVPPDVAPADAEATGCERWGMEAVLAEAERTRAHRLTELADARTLVDQALDRLHKRLVERMVAPLCAAVQRRFRQTAREGTERLLERELVGLDEPAASALRRWAETLASRFAHLSTAGVREVAQTSGPDAVRAFFRRADPELAAELRAACSTDEALSIDAAPPADGAQEGAQA